ncbi:MAG: DinB family protein [Bacteroidales bacterium]|nr:DinB family protein [Bacteroidales bacterium]
MTEIDFVINGILSVIEVWEPRLLALSEDKISKKRNSQNRTVKQIVGHMCDSASNNTHRAVHLQYQKSPLDFPNYAIDGNNDRWIAIQNYQDEDWHVLLQLWKYSNIHIAHVFRNIDESKLSNKWKYSEDRLITLKEGIIDYLRHLKLHLSEIEELMNS